MYSFGNFQEQEVVYIGQETIIFPEYQGRNSGIYTLYLFFPEDAGTNMFGPIYINYPVI